MGMTYEYTGFYAKKCKKSCPECGGKNKVLYADGNKLVELRCPVQEQKAEKEMLKQMWNLI